MKYRRLIAATLILPTLSLATGCYSVRTVPATDLKPPGTYGYPEGEGVRGIVTATDEVVMFDEPVMVEADTLHAQVSGEPYTVALDDVHAVVVKRPDTGKSLALTLGILAGVAAVLAVAAYIALSNWAGPFGYLGSGLSVVAR